MGKLRNKIAISFAALAIVLSGAIIFGLYTYIRIQARESTRLRLMDIANTASQLIDADLHATLADPEQMVSDDYLTIRRELDNLLLNNENILYAYTMRYVDGQVIFVVDSIVGEGEPADLAEVYEEAEQVLLDYAATASEPWAEEEFTTDEWGTVLSGYAPIFTSDGRLDGIIGIDMDVDYVRAYENQFLWISLIIFLISMPIVGGLAWLVGNWLGAPVIALSRDVERIASGDLEHRAAITSRDEIAQLAGSFNQMTDRIQAMVRDLEGQVDQRTHDLEIRSQYLEATAQIGQAAAAILDMDELIGEVVEQIRTRFKLYYVGLFLTDTQHEWAILRAGTGEAGEAMVQRGHRIKIGSGMIGWSIANAQPRIAQAAEQDAVRLATAELPETRSEAALPLRSRGQVLGAISVQSAQPGAFDEGTIRVLQTMADQVAIAIDNAILFMQSQAALETERRAIGRIGREGWEKLYRAHPDLGYRYFGDMIADARGPWEDEMVAAAQLKHPVQDQEGNLAIPILVREQVIGVLRCHKEPALPAENGDLQTSNSLHWTEEEISMLQTILDQVGSAIESARLYTQTQEKGERERMASEITAKVRSSNDPQVILQTAVRELRRALRASRAQVLLHSVQAPGNDHPPDDQNPAGPAGTEMDTGAGALDE